jgi:hypothetical protein
MTNNNQLVEEMVAQTMQSDTHQDKYVGGSGAGLFMFFIQAGELIPAWWE